MSRPLRPLLPLAAGAGGGASNDGTGLLPNAGNVNMPPAAPGYTQLTQQPTPPLSAQPLQARPPHHPHPQQLPQQLPTQLRGPHTHHVIGQAKASTPLTQRRRRDTSSIACNMCRTKKTACDRVRPSCALCIDRGSRCVYRTNYRTSDAAAASANTAASEALQQQLNVLQTRLKDQSDMVQALAALPPEAAVDILRLLRTTKEPFSVLASLHGSMHTRLRPSDYRVSRSVSPPTHSHMEFELAARYRAVYARLEPVDDASLQSLILIQGSIDGGGYYGGGNSVSPESQDDEPSVATPTLSAIGIGHQDNTFTPASPLPAPYSEAGWHSRTSRYIDPRLEMVQIEYWTSVPISNEMAASILSFYLKYDHILFNIFDTDLFLTDLVECRSDFCSAFLVNSIMFFACQAYTAIDTSAAPLVHAFFRETDMLWQGQGNVPSLIGIAACEIFSMGSYFYGRDEHALAALVQGRRMAEKMDLLSISQYNEASIAHFQQQSPKWLRTAAHVAWGVHNWLSAHVFYYNGEPISHPPILPPPGSTEAHYSDEFKKMGLTIKWSKYTNKTFPGISQFWAISQEVATVYLNQRINRNRPLAEQVPVAFAEEKYRKLLAWADTMVDVIDDRQTWLLLVYQCWFHCTVLHIFRPFLHEKMAGQRKPPRPRPLRSFAAMDGSPETVFDASVQQLKNLVYIYLSNLSRIPLSGFFNAAYVLVGHSMIQSYRTKHRVASTPSSRLSISSQSEASGMVVDSAKVGDISSSVVIEEIDDDDDEVEVVRQTPREAADDKKMLRMYFLLCVRAWTDLYMCFPTFSEFTQAFLSMAMEAEIMTGAEAQASLARLRANGQHHHNEFSKPVLVSSLIDFDRSLSNPEEASVNTLAQRFNDLATFSELTNAEDFVAAPDDRVQEL